MEVAGRVSRIGYCVTTFPPDISYWSANLGGVVSKLEDATWYSTHADAQRLIEQRNLFMVASVTHVAEVRTEHS